MSWERLHRWSSRESLVNEEILSQFTSDLASYQEMLIASSARESNEHQEKVRVIKLTYAQAHKKLSQPLTAEEIAWNIIYTISDRTRPKYTLPKKYQDKENIIIHGSCWTDIWWLEALVKNADFWVFISKTPPRTFITDLNEVGWAWSMRYMINNNPLTNLSSIGVEFSAPGDPNHTMKVPRKKDGAYVYKDGKKVYDIIHTETLIPTSAQIDQFRRTKQWMDSQLWKKLTITTSYQWVDGQPRKMIHSDTKHRPIPILKSLWIRLQLERWNTITDQDRQTYLDIIQDMYKVWAISETRKDEYTRYINNL